MDKLYFFLFFSPIQIHFGIFRERGGGKGVGNKLKFLINLKKVGLTFFTIPLPSYEIFFS